MTSEPVARNSSRRGFADRLFERTNLTHSQLLIWMGQQLEPDSPLYNMVLCFRFGGAINTGCFRQAFSRLVSRSDALRTVFEVVDGVPMQRVLDQLDYRVEIVDLSDEDDPQQALSEWMEPHNRQCFDLSRCSFESTLLLMGDGKTIWYLNQHHLTTDGWSTSLIYKNVAGLYLELLEGDPASSSELPAWSDYLVFERNHDKGVAHEKAIEHWRRRAQAQIDPVCFYSRKPVVKHAATRRVACALGEERTQKLKQLALSEGFRSLNINVTLFNMFLVALSGWIFRVSDSRKLAIAAPAHNRSSLAFRETIGMFIEMFPLHIEHEDGQTFRDLFDHVSSEAQSWLRNAQPGTSSMAGARQFNVVLNYIHATFAPFAGIPVEAEWVHTGYGDLRHDLRLQVHDFGDSGSFLLYFDFNEDTFPQTLQERAVSHFLSLMDAFIDNPTGRIDKVALATPHERQHYLLDYNQTEVPDVATVTVLDKFREQCAGTADAPAVILGDRQMSYAELDRRSDDLAARLQQRGITLGALVGIHLTRSIEMVVAVLGVLKSGAAYVPLESRLPAARLDYILRETAVAMVLTESGLAEHLKPYSVDCLCLDTKRLDTGGNSQVNVCAAPDDTAYVIYTSGSTGQPKGVIINHRGLHDYINWAARTFADELPLNFALHSSFGFDLTVTSLFVPLTCGGAVVVYPEEDIDADLSIIQVFEDNRSDIVKLTPAHLRLVLSTDVSRSRVSRLILGGEDLKIELCNRAISAFPGGVTIFNEYGPTEAVVGCMVHCFDPLLDTDSSVPIGRPADNTRVYVLDAGLNPVVQGAVGEMYVSRSGLAPGYLGREDLTAERFIDNPFMPGQRMYRTGDLARFRSDSVMEYLGRTDEQVKIRGVRIEPAEVEHALLEHPDIEQCVLQIVQPERVNEANYREFSSFVDPDEKRLAAYYTSGKFLTVSELKAWLGQRLPAAMVPTFLVQMDAIPLTGNGKVNRSGLPDPREQQPQLAEAYCPPRNELEETLVRIWSEALGVARIGVHDNYFDLGGDSIIAIQIVGRASDAGIQLAPNELFLHQTIAGLAAVARATRTIVREQPMEPGPVPMTPIQHWFFAQQPPRPDHFSQSVLLDVHADVDAGQLNAALQQLQSRHEALRLRFRHEDGNWVQELPEHAVAIELQRIGLPSATEERERLVQQTEQNMNESLDLANGKLVAAALLESQDGQSRQLLMVIHHLVVDAVSWLFLLEDLDTTCKQLAAGQAVSLPTRTSSCRSWAQLLERSAVSPEMQGERAFWSSALQGQVIPVPHEGVKESTRRCVSVTLPAETTQRLLAQGLSKWQMQIHEVLLAALAMTLAAHTGSPDINISLESHGREDMDSDIDITRTVGWFTAVYPVALHIGTNASLDDAMQFIRNKVREVPRQGIGFGLLKYPVQDGVTTYDPPWGGVVMNYLGRSGRLLKADSWFQFARPLAVSRAAENRMCFAWEINAWLGEDGLHVDWDYSDLMSSREDVEKLAGALLDRLRSVAEDRAEISTVVQTGNDFPLAGLDREQLGKLATLLNKG